MAETLQASAESKVSAEVTIIFFASQTGSVLMHTARQSAASRMAEISFVVAEENSLRMNYTL
ncbi:MAG: hypothetical protein IJC93_11260 [Clostridia bacterium]|nr:hypothetical protein [Clostridia bacterium]